MHSLSRLVADRGVWTLYSCILQGRLFQIVSEHSSGQRDAFDIFQVTVLFGVCWVGLGMGLWESRCGSCMWRGFVLHGFVNYPTHQSLRLLHSKWRIVSVSISVFSYHVCLVLGAFRDSVGDVLRM